MEFEYDSKKSFANKAKHGIDFEEAKMLWLEAHIVISASEFDRLFDDGKEDVLQYADLDSIAKVGRKFQLDTEATRIGVARTALIKVWLAERLEQNRHLTPIA